MLGYLSSSAHGSTQGTTRRRSGARGIGRVPWGEQHNSGAGKMHELLALPLSLVLGLLPSGVTMGAGRVW